MDNLQFSESPKALQQTPAPATQVPVMSLGAMARVNPTFRAGQCSWSCLVCEVARCLLGFSLFAFFLFCLF